MSRGPSATFDPVEWNRVYDTDGQSAQACAFLRGTEMVTAICARLSIKEKRVVDVGSGTAAAASRLARLGARVVAVDHDLAMIAYARKHLCGGAVGSSIEFAVGDALSLPLGDATCDGLVAVSLTGCLPDLRAFLREVYRVLTPGGWAVMTFTNRQSLFLRVNSALRLLNRDREDQFCFSRYRIDEVTRVLKELNFVVREVLFYNLFMTFGRRMLPPRPFAFALERAVAAPIAVHFARNYVTVAFKGPT